MWEADPQGHSLHFHLAGINNENFIMQDAESKTWWQQVNGRAIYGPKKGLQLKLVPYDELTFGSWKAENPQGRVLRPGQHWKPEDEYAEGWEAEVMGLPVVNKVTTLPPRELIIGINLDGAAKAYPYKSILKQGPCIMDTIGDKPIMILLHEDRHSIRCYSPIVRGEKLEFYAIPGSKPLRIVDRQTGSEWDFSGMAVAGSLAGTRLQQIPFLNDYWFDWKNYHPDSRLYNHQ